MQNAIQRIQQPTVICRMSNKFGIRDRNVAFKLTGVLFFVGRIMKKSFMTSLSNWLSTEDKEKPGEQLEDLREAFCR